MNTQDKLEIVFNFDTTGSMYPCLDQVRRNLENTVGSLFKEIPNLRIGLGANGDYCDLHRYGYITKQVDLTTDLYTLTQFVRNVNPTGGGGNGGEAYELVLRQAQTAFNWSLNARKILVMIGDEIAHTPNYRDNRDRIDWRQEARKLADMGIQIYTIQCLSRPEAPPYYSELARIGNGYHLYLDQFTDILSLVNAIVYRQVSEERVREYEEVVANSGRMNRTLDKSFGVLTNRPRDAKGRYVKIDQNMSADLKPVDPGRFQVMDVGSAPRVIKEFVQDHNLIFQTGRGFYEFTKREEIQPNKEVVLRDKLTGDMYTGARAREMIGIPYGMRGNVSPNGLPYDVFVQSTSYNRKLMPNTRFLYEVDMAA
jgi:hypothetical protein